MPRRLLVVGRGPGLGRALARARALGLDAEAGSPRTPVRANGLLAASPDAAVAVALAAAEAGLPGPGPAAAERLASRIALRRRLADAGVPQPRFAALRTLHERRAALAAVGLPARLVPAEPWIEEGRFELASADDLDAHLHRTLAASPEGEALVEGAPDGAQVEVVLACERGHANVVAVADRAGDDARIYPSALFGDAFDAAERTAVHAVHALELADGAVTVTLSVGEGRAELLDVRPWTPADPVDALVRHAVGVDLLELAIRLALGLPVRPRPRFRRAAALRLTGDVPAAKRSGLAERGEGYVVATADTNIAARRRAGAPG